MIINDDFRVVSKWLSKIVASLSDDSRGVIYPTREPSIVLLENIYSTGITYDDFHLQSLYFLSIGHWL